MKKVQIFKIPLALMICTILSGCTTAQACTAHHTQTAHHRSKVRCIAGITIAEAMRRAEIAQYIKDNYTAAGRK
jgi:uncharacterized membrane protein AbrB (regulator of aidB expression)